MHQTLLINLDRSPERLARMADQLGHLGMAFERLPATEGARLSDEELNAVSPPILGARQLNVAEIGIFLSQRHAWQIAAGSEAEWTLILEDDVTLAEDLPALLEVLSDIPDSIGLVRLETTLRKAVLSNNSVPLTPGRCLRAMHSWHGGTAGYLVRRATAARLLGLAPTTRRPVDVLLFDPSSPIFEQARPFQTYPAAAMQRDMAERRAGQNSDTTIRGAAFGSSQSGGIASFTRWAGRSTRRIRSRMSLAHERARSDRSLVYVPFVDQPN